MNDLLTHKEIQSIAKNINYPSNQFINGGFKKSFGKESINNIDPNTKKIINKIYCSNEKDLNFAVLKSREAFEDGRWSRLHPSERKNILVKLCKLIERNKNELCVLECIDSGKPIRDIITIDLPETINTLKWHAELADKIYDQAAPVGHEAMSIIIREPVGVVGCVLPWNFPMLMLAWKIGPALASGNSVIVKPAEQTSLTSLRIAELAKEAGIPDGVFNVVLGLGSKIGKAIGLHNDIDMVSFTGSTVTGKKFLEYSSNSNLKNITLECGGKNPAIVLEDAEDLDNIAKNVVQGGFWNMGQNCSASSRLIVHKKVKEALIKKIIARSREWRTGDPTNPIYNLGTLVSKEHFKKVENYLKIAKKKKLKLILGGETKDNKYVFPTIFECTNLKHNSKLIKEEIFGPILVIITVSSDEEAIQIANNTLYGLTASIFTSNNKKAMRAARDIKAGTVTVNTFGEGDATTPFGGFKQSGFGGRDNGIHAHDQYTNLKTIWFDCSDNKQDEIS